MAVRYLIIKHLSLGYGVLLKRENNDLGKIYFSDAKSSKSVILSHPYLSVAEGLSLNKFVSLGLYEGLFDNAVKEEAQEYLDGHIKNMHLSENECYGSILGSHEYSFRITIDSNSFINLSCTCGGNACKHLYAVFTNIKKLIDPHASDTRLASTDNTNEFKNYLEKFLYVRGADNIALVNKFNYMIRNYDKCKLFIDTILPFYQRGQYKARVINDILAPLFFNMGNESNFVEYAQESGSNEIQAMVDEATNYFTGTLLKDFERKNSETKKANLYNILLAPNCAGLISLLKHAEDNYSEERIASQVMVEYIKYNDLTIEDIASLKSSYIFQMNHRYYMSDIMSSPAKNRLSTYLLFFDELPLDENKIKQIPLDYLLKVSSFSNDKSHYVQIAHSYFDQIKEEDIPLLAELLVGVSLQHDYVDERTIRLTIELSKKIPASTYIQEIVDNNIRRPKKAKVR